MPGGSYKDMLGQSAHARARQAYGQASHRPGSHKRHLPCGRAGRACQVEQLGEERAAGGLALDAGLGHAGHVQHHVAVLLVDALRAIAQRRGHLALTQTKLNASRSAWQPRRPISVLAVTLSAILRTTIFNTAAHLGALEYAVLACAGKTMCLQKTGICAHAACNALCVLETVLQRRGARLAVGHAQRGFQRGQVLYGVLVKLALPQQVPLPASHMPSVSTQTRPTIRLLRCLLIGYSLSQRITYHPPSFVTRDQLQLRCMTKM